MSTTVATEVNCTLDITPPKNWAVALFDSFDSIDVFGRLNPLFYLAFSRQLNLALLAETLDPVWVRPVQESLNTQNSSFWFSVNPTHTYDNPPEGVEVLLVPGGPGATVGDAKRVVEYVRGTYPSLKYLITTCTGAGIAARAGVLDGKRATTNKAAWSTIVKMGPNVNWVSPARWVVDGNIWTASGVTSGLDLIFAFLDQIYGQDLTRRVQGVVEYERNKGACSDPFAEWHGVPPTGECVETQEN
ncbi:DJ-1/PfpI family protein [Colletotrichum tofieldiae]|uniref:DJ-1/PfpI family protein n=1 Tax=Colletotrichum tofieldiae TaxID=708197 RepID=A0A166W2E6_9PEZI|nr:DJ-1/PfpI family protein [Colletotrichum tofieldiae]